MADDGMLSRGSSRLNRIQRRRGNQYAAFYYVANLGPGLINYLIVDKAYLTFLSSLLSCVS